MTTRFWACWIAGCVASTLVVAPVLGPCPALAADGGWSGPSGPSGADPDAEADKLNGYVKGYNTLIGTFGLRQQFAQYAGQRIPEKGLNDPVFVNPGWIGNGLDALRSARAIRPGTPSALDAAADPLIATLATLVDRLDGLAAYYRSRGQLTDHFALGKRQDPLVVAGFRQSLAELAALSDAIDREQDLRDARELASLKASGDRVAYDTTLALQKSKRLLGLFGSAADLRDASKLAAADGLAAEVQAALFDEQLARARSPGSGGINDSMDDSAAEALQTLLGHYRDLRHGGTPFNLQLMVYSYNNAVQQHNYGQL